jgi:ABC-2 type transport system ATP-binding protein
MTIKITQVSKSYNHQKALDQVSFQVETGELLGFLGPNGAGKSSLMKIMTGYLATDGGSVEINGQKVENQHIALRAQIGYLPENNPLYTDMYVREYLEMIAGIYKIEKKKEQVMRMIEMTGLKAEQHKKIGALSKGFRQRVGLAQALIHDPAVLILDEPTTGLDPNQLDEIRQLISTFSKNKTVILSTHIMQEVEAICNRVIIINHGQVVADGSVAELKSGKFAQRQKVWIEFDRSPDPETFRQIEGLDSLEQTGPSSFLAESKQNIDLRPKLFQFAVANQLVLLTMKEQQQSLESVFQELTK